MKRAKNGQIASYTRRVDSGVERLCHGPAHDKPVWLPETEKFFFKRKTGKQAGTFVSQCRLCRNWTRVRSPGEAGYVPVHRVRPFIVEGVNKVGMKEFSRRVNVSPSRLKSIIDKPRGKMQKRVVKRVLLEVTSIRRKGEVRHRDSIAAGSLARGLPEKEVTNWRDLYKPNGDEEAERGRARRLEAV